MNKLSKYRFMIINENKEPMHSFDEDFAYDHVEKEPNLAIRINEPYVILDIDEPDAFEIVKNIVLNRKIKTRILKTSRGGHFWFRSQTPLKNAVGSNTPLTVKIDIKSWGKKTMEVVKLNGKWREWLQFDEIVDEIPSFLRPINYKKDLMYLEDGDGRNNGLFTFIIPLVNEGFSKDEIIDVFQLINKHIFTEPLSDNEIKSMFSDNTLFEEGKMFYKGSKFLHNVFADYMIKEFHIKGFSKKVYFYHNNTYTDDMDVLSSKMLDIIPTLNRTNLDETLRNITLKKITENIKPNGNYISLQNGLYNLSDHVFLAHTPHIFVLNQINCEYDPNAYDEQVYSTIQSLACNDEEIITVLIQLLGYTLLGDNRFQKAFILLGNGRNGKSMFLEMIAEWVGEDNVSSVPLEELSLKFRTAELVGKMVNIGDDIDHRLLDATSTFKKLVSGDSLTVERKNQHPFKFANTAKLIFSANNLPPTTDKSEGFFRRCVIIPFDAVYHENDKGYDPYKIEKLTTQSAKNYLFLLAIEGVKSLQEYKRFTIPKTSSTLLHYYEVSNNNVMMWYHNLTEKPMDVKDAYTSYLLYCTTNNYKPLALSRFNTEFEKIKKIN